MTKHIRLSDSSNFKISIGRVGIIFFFLFILVLPLVYSQGNIEEEKIQVPAGMEILKIGKRKDLTILVPKGTKVTQESNVLLVEGIGEYSARRFEEIEARFKNLEARLEDLKKQIEQLKKDDLKIQIGQLKKMVDELQKHILSLVDKKSQLEEKQ
ncbi:MAG: hypothetical protein Q8N14_03945 [Candidatus Omnitrophota bacterium]|nr:hypothetical protein [Candidatus Omnitrophota bacterium]